MRTLIIYYSYEGNTEFVANLIAQETQADILKLEPENEKKHKGLMKYIWGAKQVFTKTKTKLKPFNKNPMDYDLIFIGTPVWANTYAPALAAFFDAQNISSKKIALFCCCGGMQGNTFRDIKRRIPDNEFLSQLVLRDPLMRDKEGNFLKVKEWVREL